MTDTQESNKEEAREKDITAMLYSKFAEPNRKAFPFPDGTLYAVLKMAWCANAHDHRPAIVWIAIFPPRGAKTGISWQTFFVDDEWQGRVELARIDEESAAHFHAEMRADYDSPATY